MTVSKTPFKSEQKISSFNEKEVFSKVGEIIVVPVSNLDLKSKSKTKIFNILRPPLKLFKTRNFKRSRKSSE